jgi:hypothetical protein
MGSLWPARGKRMRIILSDPGEAMPLNEWWELIKITVAHVTPRAEVQIEGLTVSDSPRGPVYSETAMEWERQK